MARKITSTARSGELSGSRLDEAGGSGVLFEQQGTLNTSYEEGRLVLDILDRKTGQIVHRDTTKTAMLEKPSASRFMPRIAKAVEAMLKDFRKR